MPEDTFQLKTTEAPFSYPGWPTKQELPPEPPVTLLFKGLVAFSYNPSVKRAEIVFNSGDQRHNLEISVREDEQPVELNLPTPTNISLGIEGLEPCVYFLEHPSAKDFGYLLNLNDQEKFYPGKTPQKPFGVKLLVNHGTFYTTELTKFAIARVTVPPGNFPLPAWDERRLDHLAKYVSTAIELSGSQQVLLKVNDEIRRFPSPGKTTKITFDNECRENGKLCEHNTSSPFEFSRNDFYFHRNILDLSLFDPRYGLRVAKEELTPDGLDPSTGREPDSNDEAPCMGSGYGGANGLPPF